MREDGSSFLEKQKAPVVWIALFILVAWIALLLFAWCASPESIQGLADLLNTLGKVLKDLK